MDDAAIIELFHQRDERAIRAADDTYGDYCRSISMRILGSPSDAEECVNDTFLRAWNTIPPQCPAKLSLYLGRIARNLSIDRARKNKAAKRGGGNYEGLLEELEPFLPCAETVEQAVEDAAVAVQFPETGKAYAYVNTDYKPATLGQFWGDLNLNEYLTFGRVYFEMTDYIDPPQSEIDKLLNRSAPCTTGDNHLKNTVMLIDIDVPVLGYTNHAFQLTSDGYLHTNLLESGKNFYIGKERVKRLLDYVQANCTAVSYTPTTVAYTAVMTSGAKCPVEE